MSKHNFLMRVSKMKLIICVLLLLVPTLTMGSTSSSPYFQRHPEGVIKAEVSAKEFSRIHLSKGMIYEVIGDESNYQLLSDQFGSNVFIKPRVLAGNSFAISLVSNNGAVIDMHLTVKDIKEPSVITIDVGIAQDKAISQKVEGKSLSKEEILMLKSMKLGRKHKYYVLEVGSVIPPQKLPYPLRDTQVTKKTIYKFGDLTGVILGVKNNAEQTLTLKEEDFSHLFCGNRAVHIENDHLANKVSTRVFIITKEEGKC